jgi:hypothetical protein
LFARPHFGATRLAAGGLSKSVALERHCQDGALCAVVTVIEERTMKYMLMIYGDEAGESKTPASDMNQIMAAYQAYSEALLEAGVMSGGERLHPSSTATTVRVAGGKTSVLNGPYAESREQCGGFYLIDVPDLDSALSWAARCPGASHGVVEVRPIWAM